jgi:hypothetical protein
MNRLASARAETLYARLLALNLVLLAGHLVYKFVATPSAIFEYAQRLVTYRDGFIRRGLVGEIYGWFTDRVPFLAVKIEGSVTFLVLFAAYALLARRTLRVGRLDACALGCFVLGSPFFFKNFAHNLHMFDMLGALLVVGALLAPLGAWAHALFAALGVALLCVHHIHATLYVPTLLACLLLRMVGEAGAIRPRDLAVLAGMTALWLAVFLFIVVAGSPSTPMDAFAAQARARAVDPVLRGMEFMWYSTLRQEMEATWRIMGRSLAWFPVYAAIFALHWPLIRAARTSLARIGATKPLLLTAYLGALAVVSAAYLVTLAVNFDHARFVSNWMVCLLLLTHAAIVAADGAIRDADDLRPLARATIVCAAILAIIPRVGTVVPIPP